MIGHHLVPRLYARALRCYPRAFKHAFADSMLEDFLDATADARREGRVAVALCCARVAVDLARSLTVQWLRRPQPWLVLTGILCAILCVQAMVRLAPAAPAPAPMPATDDEAELLVLMFVAALFPVVAVILFVWSFLPPIPPGRRRA